MKKIFTLCFLVVLSYLNGWGQYSTMSGIPIAYWDFESNSNRSALETAPELQINSGNTYDGKFGGNYTGNYLDNGNGGNYSNVSYGTCLAGVSWATTGTDPKASATTYFQFSLNTTGFTGVSFSFDAITGTTTSSYPYIGILYSTDGTTYNWLNSYNLGNNYVGGGTTAWTNNINFTLPSSADNNANLKIRIYGYFGANTTSSLMEIDNLMLFASGTSLNAGSKTSVDEKAFYIGTTSGSTSGSQYIRYNTFTVESGSTLVLGNGGVVIGNSVTSGTLTVNSNGTLDCGGTSDQTVRTGTSGLSTFNLNLGASIIIRNSSGISSSGAAGDIQTTTRNFSTGANYGYASPPATAQITGTGLPATVNSLTIANTAGVTLSGAVTTTANLTITNNATLDVSSSNYSVSVKGDWINSGTFSAQSGTVTFNGTASQVIKGNSSTSFYNLILNNSAGATLSIAQTVSNIFTLTAGILTTSSTNLLSVSNTAAGAIVGGSTTAFVNGPLQRTLPKSLNLSSSIYNYPVGTGTTYLPFSVSNLTTNQFNFPTLKVQAFAGDVGGTGDNSTLATNGSLSTTEYWLSTSNNYISNGTISLTRQAALGNLNVIATSNTKAGPYSSKGGTPSGTSINNSTNLASFNSQYFAMAQAPSFAISSALSPTAINACFGTASSNMTLSVSGGATINGVTVTPPSGFEASLSAGSGFASSVTAGGSGTFASTPVYIRLKSSDPVATYSGNITLTSTSVTSQSTAIGNSVVKPLPTATITPTSGSACEGTAVALNITGTSGASVDYNVNSGTTQTITLPATSFNSPTNANTYTYTLTGVTLNGCSGTFTNSSSVITINPNPTVAAIGGSNYVQTGTTQQLTNSTTGGVWATSQPAIASLNSTTGSPVTVTGSAEGVSNISYTVTSNSCATTVNKSVRVYNPDYITQTSGNFSNAATWQIDRDDNTFVTSVPVPSGSNYTSIRVQNALTLDQDFQVGSSKSFSLITGGTMDIASGKTFSSLGNVDFGGKLVTVKSDASGTGAIASMASAIANANNVQIERFIGSSNFATGRRAWRLVTAPVTGVTINNAWQEGQLWNGTGTNPSTGYGTLITGYTQHDAATANSHGYDFWDAIANSSSSIRYYVGAATSGTWNSLPGNGLLGLNVEAYPAYMLFVRGDRSTLNTGFSLTTLRAKGTLKQGLQTMSVSSTNAYSVVGNPYASPIDFEKIYTDPANSGVIQPQFLVWNSQNGNYGSYTLVQRNSANNYTAVPNKFNTGGTGTASSNQYIVSGQGFLVQPNAGGTLTITEGMKTSSASSGINPYRISPETDKRLYVNLNLKGDTSATLADGFLARFDASYTSDINEDDALKQANFNENLGINSNTTDLIIEARPDAKSGDTLKLKLWNVMQRNYQLQLLAENFAGSVAAGLHAYVVDNCLGTKQEADLSGAITTLDFSVNSDAASYAQDRFRIVFGQSDVLPVTLTSVKAAAQNGGVNVTWTVTNEVNMKQYTVERSTDGGQSYTAIATQTAKNTAGAAFTNYQSFDAQPQKGDNLYRIRLEYGDGKTTYSSVVKITIAVSNTATQITLYPNPVRKDGRVNLQLINLAADSYLVSVYSSEGKTVYQKKITLAQSNSTQSEELRLGASLAQGSYPVRITNSKDVTVYNDKLIVGK